MQIELEHQTNKGNNSQKKNWDKDATLVKRERRSNKNQIVLHMKKVAATSRMEKSFSEVVSLGAFFVASEGCWLLRRDGGLEGGGDDLWELLSFPSKTTKVKCC